MNDEDTKDFPGAPGAFGVNYALRPHKFVDRRVFLEVITRYSNFNPIQDYIYVGLGSFAMEDHKLINATFGLKILLSLETDSNVVKRQKFNTPLACIKPTSYSTKDFVVMKSAIFREFDARPDANAVVWFDMTDAEPLRVHLDNFRDLLRCSQPGDIVRITVDIDEKTLGTRNVGERPNDLNRRRFARLQQLLGDEMKVGARARQMENKLGIARLVTYAFRLVAENAFALDPVNAFEPVSITTYADGHRMLSVTGAIIKRESALECRTKMNLSDVPGGATGWDDLVNIQIPQLTVWEKLNLDREVHAKTPRQLARKIKFRLHETISTVDLLKGYSEFQRFYPTFRHVLL